MPSLVQTPRFARAIRLAMLVACVAFILGALAHASHFHKTDAAGHEETACQLCLQLDRVAPPPAAASIRLASFLVVSTALPANDIAPPNRLDAFYSARGPPQR